jgi:hypothetical protein
MSDEKPTKAWELIASPERWEQNGHLASDTKGRDVDPMDLKAVKWCPFGAMIKVHGELAGDLLQLIKPNIPKSIFNPSGSIGPWNDDKLRKHSGVVALLKQYDI